GTASPWPRARRSTAPPGARGGRCSRAAVRPAWPLSTARSADRVTLDLTLDGCGRYGHGRGGGIALRRRARRAGARRRGRRPGRVLAVGRVAGRARRRVHPLAPARPPARAVPVGPRALGSTMAIVGGGAGGPGGERAAVRRGRARGRLPVLR